QEGLYQHFKAIAQSTSLPIMLYNIPPRTVINMDTATIMRLAEIPNIIAIKEASKNMDQIADIVAQAPEGFSVYSGDDSMTLPILAVGGVGVVSVTAHIAGIDLKQMHESFFAGAVPAARAIHLHRI